MSALDELLSPENFPPADPLRGDAERELASLRAELERIQRGIIDFSQDPNAKHDGMLLLKPGVTCLDSKELDRLRRENAALLDEVEKLRVAEGMFKERLSTERNFRKNALRASNDRADAAERERDRAEMSAVGREDNMLRAEVGRLREENAALLEKAMLADDIYSQRYKDDDGEWRYWVPHWFEARYTAATACREEGE